VGVVQFTGRCFRNSQLFLKYLLVNWTTPTTMPVSPAKRKNAKVVHLRPILKCEIYLMYTEFIFLIYGLRVLCVYRHFL
jgi:hypothetical protein